MIRVKWNVMCGVAMILFQPHAYIWCPDGGRQPLARHEPALSGYGTVWDEDM